MKKEQLEHYMTIDEVATRFQVHRGTLCNWRTQGVGPKYVKIGRTILYAVDDIEAFEKESQKRSTVG